MDSKTAVLSGASTGRNCPKHVERMQLKNDLSYSVTKIKELIPRLRYLTQAMHSLDCQKRSRSGLCSKSPAMHSVDESVALQK